MAGAASAPPAKTSGSSITATASAAVASAAVVCHAAFSATCRAVSSASTALSVAIGASPRLEVEEEHLEERNASGGGGGGSLGEVGEAREVGEVGEVGEAGCSPDGSGGGRGEPSESDSESAGAMRGKVGKGKAEGAAAVLRCSVVGGVASQTKPAVEVELARPSGVADACCRGGSTPATDASSLPRHLALTSTLPRNASGDGSGASALGSRDGAGSSRSPSTILRMAAILTCCSQQQCISSERISGYGDATKPESASATTTSTNLIRVHSVWPCVISGSPSAPSQQSSSTQRYPISSWRRYMSADDSERSWWPVRYELCDEAMKYSLNGRLMSWQTPACSGSSASLCAESSHAAKRGRESFALVLASLRSTSVSSSSAVRSPAACAQAHSASTSSAPCSCRQKRRKDSLSSSSPSAYSSKMPYTPPASSSRDTQRSTISIEKRPSPAGMRSLPAAGSFCSARGVAGSWLGCRISPAKMCGVLLRLVTRVSSMLSVRLSANRASQLMHSLAHAGERRALSRSMHTSSSCALSARCSAAEPLAQKASRTRATLAGLRASWLATVGSMS